VGSQRKNRRVGRKITTREGKKRRRPIPDEWLPKGIRMNQKFRDNAGTKTNSKVRVQRSSPPSLTEAQSAKKEGLPRDKMQQGDNACGAGGKKRPGKQRSSKGIHQKKKESKETSEKTRNANGHTKGKQPDLGGNSAGNLCGNTVLSTIGREGPKSSNLGRNWARGERPGTTVRKKVKARSACKVKQKNKGEAIKKRERRTKSRWPYAGKGGKGTTKVSLGKKKVKATHNKGGEGSPPGGRRWENTETRGDSRGGKRGGEAPNSPRFTRASLQGKRKAEKSRRKAIVKNVFRKRECLDRYKHKERNRD